MAPPNPPIFKGISAPKNVTHASENRKISRAKSLVDYLSWNIPMWRRSKTEFTIGSVCVDAAKMLSLQWEVSSPASASLAGA